MDGDLILLHQMRDALIQLLGHATRPFHHGVNIRAYVGGGQAIVARMLHIMINLRRAQQRLGRDAPPIEANPAETFALNNGGFEAELHSADGGNITTGAGTKDDEIIIRHFGFSLKPLPLRERVGCVWTVHLYRYISFIQSKR